MLSRVAFLLLAIGATAFAQSRRLLNEKRIHLGVIGSPEWEEFADDPPQSERFELRFAAERNPVEGSLFIRQDGVKQDWIVQLNGRRVGKLFLMEADLVQTINIPRDALRDGENVLSIFPALPDTIDDIVLHEIALDDRPPRQATAIATLNVDVADQAGQPLPCRITIVDAHGTLAAMVYMAEETSLALRPGVAYTANGRAQVGLRPGRHTVFASRGFEYGVASQQVEIVPGESHTVALRLAREVPTPGLVSCDTHIHTLTNSGHGDATLEERLLTLAGEGIELPVATDHDFHTDYFQSARWLTVKDWSTPVIGNEVTTRAGHFNVFPIDRGAPVADAKITDWPVLMKAMRATPGVRVVVLNHPRSIHTGFRPFDPVNFNAVTGDNKRGPEFSFDALEVLNSGAQQTDFMLVYRDWFALLNHGYRVVTVGASDSHDVSRFIVGQARTYIAAPDADPAHINVSAACQSLLHGRAFVSMGLLTRMTVEEKFEVGDLATGLPDNMRVDVKVLGPSWVKAGQVALFANGIKIREEAIKSPNPVPDKAVAVGEKARITWSIPRPPHDVHLVAIATGPAVTAPFWAMTKPYQPMSSHWEGRAIGSTNAIWIDGDGDGKFTAARDYARRLVEDHGPDPRNLLPALREFDEAVAAQAASVCAAMGETLTEPGFAEALKSAAPHVGTGFKKYISAASASEPPFTIPKRD